MMEANSENPNRTEDRSLIRELRVALILIGIFLLINLAVATRTPVVWVDEPGYADPAANLYFGQGFTSTMWAQERTALWVGNVPLYQFLLYAFFKVFGFGLFQARAVNTILAAAAAFFIWGTTIRNGLIRTSLPRLFCLALLLSGATTTLTIRTIRPDTTMWFICAVVYGASSIRSSPLRNIVLLFSSMFLPVAGIPMIPYVGLVLGIYILVYRGKYFGSACTVGFGVAVGILLLLLSYNHVGMLSKFIEIILPFTALSPSGSGPGPFSAAIHKIGFDNTENLLESFFGWPLEFVRQNTLFDPSAALLFIVVILLGFKYYKYLEYGDRQKVWLAILITLVVPPVLQIAGHYRSMYRWMTYVPLCILAPAVFERILRFPNSQKIKTITLSLFVLAITMGIPLRTAFLIRDWKERSVAPLDQVVRQIIRSSDVVICDRRTYFSIRPRASLVFVTGLPARGVFELIKDLPKERISVLCLTSEDFSKTAPKIGGRWERIPIEDTAEGHLLQKSRYAVEFYRRADSAW